MATIDIDGLVEDGILDLDDVFSDADWSTVGDAVATFVRCVYGPEGNDPGVLEVRIVRAECYGIVGYRWTEADDAGVHDEGPIRLSRSHASEEGLQYARDQDES